MNRLTPKAPEKLRIWQQNTRKSDIAQAAMLNTASPLDWDVLAIQEPFLDRLGNTKASPHWRVIYPTSHRRDGSTRTRSVLLINTNIATDSFVTLNLPSTDITAVRFIGDHGSISIFNIYNACENNNTLDALDAFLSSAPTDARPLATDQMLWIGDFNRHHPSWESIDNRRLNNVPEFIQPLLAMIETYDMDLALPPGLPTLQMTAGNWTRPDNVWCTHSETSPIISCEVVPSLRPPITDHLPIVTVLELPVPRSPSPPTKDFRNADWTRFCESLVAKLQLHLPAAHILTKGSFDSTVTKLTSIIKEVIADEDTVPTKNPSPFTKRWWSKDLSKLKAQRRKASNESHKLRDLKDHPIHKEAARLSREMAEAIKKSKDEHWKSWLENINARQIYTANKYAISGPTDFACDRVPSLKDPSEVGDAAATTNGRKAQLLAKSFFPPLPTISIPSSAYPEPIPDLPFFSRARIIQATQSLQPFKAPGPDGIPNIVLKRCADELADHLYFIYRAVFELDVYHQSWLESTTLVLRKPGKPAYNVANAYRPIGLLNTIGKLLSTLVAADLSHLAEKHALLPSGQFGGRPSRNTTDAMHLITHRIKKAWRSGKVASALFLDVQGAFPNTVPDRLIHNMRKKGVPSRYIQLARQMLTNRRTQLRFDDYSSDWISIDNGTTQGCPLSMIFYSFYNAPLLLTAHPNSSVEASIGFVDDAMFLAIADTLADAHRVLADMMARADGGFGWSDSHNSPFELTKLALMNYPRSTSDLIPPDLALTRIDHTGSTSTLTVKTVPTYKYLGVVFDSRLRWSAHAQVIAAKATWWSQQVARLSRLSGGMPPNRMRQLYNTVAIPAFTYAADVWYSGVSEMSKGSRRTGSVAVTKRLCPAQRSMAKQVTGALRTTAGDVLEVFANLLPIDLLFRKVLTRAALRLASLPQSHPLRGPVRNSVRSHVRRHRSPLHNLFSFTGVTPDHVERVHPTRRRPGYAPAFSIHIPESKDEALDIIEKVFDSTSCSVFCDGSGFEGGIGASAVLYVDGVETSSRKFHLGSGAEHIVYEGEIVGLCLGLHILHSLNKQLRYKIAFGSDSQATLKALKNQKPHPAHYLLDQVHDMAEALHRKQDRLLNAAARRSKQATANNRAPRSRRVVRLHFHWSPGHEGFSPNEKADQLAKEAAQGESSPPEALPAFLRRKALPVSIPASRQADSIATEVLWKRRWKKSPRFRAIARLDRTLPSRSYMRTISSMNRKQAAILTQLRTGHIPLNHHLFRINRAESPVCPHCANLTVETVEHFLTRCPHYSRERFTHLTLQLKRKAESISYLLSAPEALKHLLRYTEATKRFHPDRQSTVNDRRPNQASHLPQSTT